MRALLLPPCLPITWPPWWPPCSIPPRPPGPVGCGPWWSAGPGPSCGCPAAIGCALAPLPLAGTFRVPDSVPVALAQLSLKLPPDVLADWRRRAAAAGHGASVRDWLLAELSGPAEAPGAALGVADRLAALEAATAELRGAVAQLQQARPPRSPRPASAAPPAAPVPIPAGLPADGIETAALAQLLGVKRHTMNARISRAGGAAPGLVVDGWRCLGLRMPERGGPPRALWVPVAT
jgi:hypothetical protein